MGSGVTPEAASIIEELHDALLPILGIFRVQNLVAVLTVVAGAIVCYVFLWWGLRKAINALMSAFRKGKVSL